MNGSSSLSTQFNHLGTMSEELDSPVTFIKKRTKLRPSGSTSSLRSVQSPSTLSFPAEEGEDDDSGNVAVIRQKKKKTPLGVVKSREGLPKSRLSFGAPVSLGWSFSRCEC